MVYELYLSESQPNKKQMCLTLGEVFNVVCKCRYQLLVIIDWRTGWNAVTLPSSFLELWLRYKCSTLSFNSYADLPVCPEIPESERIDCAPGQVVTEVREMGSLLLPAGFYLKEMSGKKVVVEWIMGLWFVWNYFFLTLLKQTATLGKWGKQGRVKERGGGTNKSVGLWGPKSRVEGEFPVLLMCQECDSEDSHGRVKFWLLLEDRSY